MADTHIHIHLNGATSEPSELAAPSIKQIKAKKVASPTKEKKPRALSAYHKEVGKQMSALKKAKFRGNVMKKAHANAKKKLKPKKRSKK
jgi:hypothetical protein